VIIYLDQNKWIELARIVNGLETSPAALTLLDEIEAAVSCDYIFPLSAVHIMEFSRIKDPERRGRLGKVMWKYSEGVTLTSAREVVSCEIEKALSQHFTSIKVRELQIIGKGTENAFGEIMPNRYPEAVEMEIFRMMLTGDSTLGLEPIQFSSNRSRISFFNHLESLQETKKQLPKSKWDDWLYAICTMDITEPLKEVLEQQQIARSEIEALFIAEARWLVDAMPSRKLDLHLHKQVLKNSQYKPKKSDLEDWAGLGLAVCYCDVVVCEKHFANMLTRDGFSTHARVITDLYELFQL